MEQTPLARRESTLRISGSTLVRPRCRISILTCKTITRLVSSTLAADCLEQTLTINLVIPPHLAIRTFERLIRRLLMEFHPGGWIRVQEPQIPETRPTS